MTQVHLTKKSANVKVGSIPVSTTEREGSCDDKTCPFFYEGCYALTGPLKLHWDKVSSHERGYSWNEFCAEISELPDNQLWRHNQAGDLPRLKNSRNIDNRKLKKLVNANAGKRGFTYCHHELNKVNIEVLKSANSAGFTVNVSANNLIHADQCYDTGLPVAVTLPITQTKNTLTPKGRAVIVCPATIKDNVSCSSCQLCSHSDRSIIIGFPAHGAQKKSVNIISQG